MNRSSASAGAPASRSSPLTWTYDVSTLAADLTAQVRLKLGDTDTDLQLLQDEEIDFFLTESGDAVVPATIAAARAVLGKYSARPSSQRAGENSVTWGDLRERLLALIDQLQDQQGALGMPFAGGTSVADVDARDEDEDKPAWAFDETGPGD